MPRGRRAAKVPRIRWDVYVRADLAAKVELLTTDPLREKAKYGARSQLIESLLEKWLAEQQIANAGSAVGAESVSQSVSDPFV